tara:strand:- start:46 stop:423 length:378 start_codon:yes stop_codon:yes gene_type:complete
MILLRLVLRLPFKFNLSDLGANEIYFNVVCSYSTSVNLESGSFAVQSVSVSGEKRGKGSLKDGFEMALRIRLLNFHSFFTPESMVLGDRIEVTVSWKVVGLKSLKFALKKRRSRSSEARKSDWFR